MKAKLATTMTTPRPLEQVARARRQFLEALDASLVEARMRGRRPGVYLVSADRVPMLERELGPEERTALLARVPGRLARCAGEQAMVALLRADTFGLLVPHLRNGLEARETASRILGHIGHPLRPAVGIAVFPCDGRSPNELLCRAAWALAQARRAARPTYSFYLRAFATSAASSSPLL
jgi:predicted signal transduction protein with EAL and GGDEF domain